jgi:hypothetical protein
VDNDPLSVRLEDDELLEEIRLLTELILTATHLNGALDQATIDRVLGLSERRQMTQRPYDGTLASP